MNDYLKQYTFQIQTKTPVYIGSGKVIGKKEYLYDRRRNIVSVLDLFKAFQGLQKKKLDSQFQAFLMDASDARDLFGFFRDSSVRQEDYEKWISYTLPMGDTSGIDRNARNISTFMKDPYGKPYVPGSSLKGALRTLLIQYNFLRNEELAAQAARGLKAAIQSDTGYSSRGFLKKTSGEIETALLHKQLVEDKPLENALNDIMKYVIVGDSKPLEPSDLCLCRKVDYTKAGEARTLPLLRECIKPGTTISFSITFDMRGEPLNRDRVVWAIRRTYENYQKKYLSVFPNVPPIQGTTVFYLGGGCGYPMKTLPVSMMDQKQAVQVTAQIMRRMFPKTRNQRVGIHENDERLGISPKVVKCTYYGDRLMQMGACFVTKFDFCAAADE